MQAVPPTALFQATNLLTSTLYFFAIDAQMSPATTRWNFLHFFVMPVWIGVGVLIPLPVVVAGGLVVFVGVCPVIEMQIYCD